jgi:predicted DNA-binding transcriptional regulator AlpA
MNIAHRQKRFKLAAPVIITGASSLSHNVPRVVRENTSLDDCARRRTLRGILDALNVSPATTQSVRREAMRKHSHPDQIETHNDSDAAVEPLSARGSLPNRLMTAFEVAEFVGCHEESVRRAYLCGQLKRQRFGVRSWRFQPADVQDWIARGAPTRIS